MLTTQTATYVRLSDVLAYMGYPELMEDASDIFQNVTWGDSMHTIVLTEYVLNMLYYWLDGTGDQTWTDMQSKSYEEKAKQLVKIHPYTDMES
jgi:hypothetical protein